MEGGRAGGRGVRSHRALGWSFGRSSKRRAQPTYAIEWEHTIS